VTAPDLVRERAHLALGAIRVFNGIAALAAPEMSARRLGVDPDANPAPLYPLRMFGVRTVALGAELLIGDETTRRRAMQVGVLIHASDTVAAARGGLAGHLPPRAGALLTAVSTLNTALAIAGSRPPRRRQRAAWLPGRR